MTPYPWLVWNASIDRSIINGPDSRFAQASPTNAIAWGPRLDSGRVHPNFRPQCGRSVSMLCRTYLDSGSTPIIQVRASSLAAARLADNLYLNL